MTQSRILRHAVDILLIIPLAHLLEFQDALESLPMYRQRKRHVDGAIFSESV